MFTPTVVPYISLSKSVRVRVLFAAFAFFICVSTGPGAQAQTLAWGYNSGVLGIGTNTGLEANPQTVTSVPDATGIGSEGEHTLFFRSNGTIVSTGTNHTGQLGTGVAGGFETTPVPVINLTNIIQVSGGGLHSAALRSDGTVWSWGSNIYGQIGNSTQNTFGCLCIATPTQSTITDVVQIDAGYYHTLALKADGTVWAWGLNDNGQIGDNSTTLSPSPVQVGTSVSGFTNIIAVSAGDEQSMALKSDGTVWIWGVNGFGQVGNGASGGSQLVPVQNTTLSNISQIAAGGLHNIARRTDGTVWVWGLNQWGAVGNGTSGGNQLTPVQNTTLSNVVEISASGSQHNLARLRDGSIRAWGLNEWGQIGDGTSQNIRTTPVTSPVGMGNAIIATGFAHSFSMKPSFTTPVGANVTIQGHNARLKFDNIITAGTTSYTSIDPTTTGLTPPAGYVIQPNAPAYNITTTAATSGNINVCLEVESEFSPVEFGLLKILHAEGGALVDRTYSSTHIRRQICARVTSLSPFVIAKGLSPTAASVSVSGRVVTSGGNGLSKAVVTMTDSRGVSRNAISSPFGYYRFDEVRAGETYFMGVSSKHYRFTPRLINVFDELTGVDFISGVGSTRIASPQ